LASLGQVDMLVQDILGYVWLRHVRSGYVFLGQVVRFFQVLSV